jgi:putative DNA primase/helicase
VIALLHWRDLAPSAESDELQKIDSNERIAWAARRADRLRADGDPDLVQIARVVWLAGLTTPLDTFLPTVHSIPNEQITAAQVEGFRQSRDEGIAFGAGVVGDLPAGKREILLSTSDFASNVQRAESALAAHPAIYQRGGAIVKVVRDAKPRSKNLRVPPGALSIIELPTSGVRERLSEAAEFFKLTPGGDEGKLVRKRVMVPRDLSEAVAQRREHDARALVGFTETPIIRPDGSLLLVPGYDRETGFLYVPSIEFPEISESPSREEGLESLARLCDLITDFPFASDADRSAAVALMLTVVGRPAIAGCTPLFAVSAADPGSGKTLICDVAALIALGRVVAKMTAPAREEEWKKSIFSVTASGTPFQLFDNIRNGGELRSETLDAVITAGVLSDRVLGHSRVASYEARAVFAATGNNYSLGGDLIRRVQPVRLVAREERPYLRDGFRYPDLSSHILKNRGTLVAAALTVLRSYFHAGCPTDGLPSFGSFVEWSALIRGSLVWLGQADPFEARAGVEQVDDARETEAEFFRALKVFANGPTLQKTASELHKIAEQGAERSSEFDRHSPPKFPRHAEFRSVLYEVMNLDPHVPLPGAKAIGRAIARLRDKTRRRMKLVCNPDNHTKIARWFVAEVAP